MPEPFTYESRPEGKPEMASFSGRDSNSRYYVLRFHRGGPPGPMVVPTTASLDSDQSVEDYEHSRQPALSSASSFLHTSYSVPANPLPSQHVKVY
jgi:hypothetical protein